MEARTRPTKPRRARSEAAIALRTSGPRPCPGPRRWGTRACALRTGVFDPAGSRRGKSHCCARRGHYGVDHIDNAPSYGRRRERAHPPKRCIRLRRRVVLVSTWGASRRPRPAMRGRTNQISCGMHRGEPSLARSRLRSRRQPPSMREGARRLSTTSLAAMIRSRDDGLIASSRP